MRSQAPMMSFRPDTLDETIFNATNAYNEYRLPDQFAPNDVIIDIGAHIGSFCYAALGRGARKVIAFEAEPANYECARKNLASFGSRVDLRNLAVWRSDQKVASLQFTPSWDPRNTGGGNVLWTDFPGLSVPAVAFDDVMQEVTRGGRRRVRLIKLDCECSEFPILLTSKTLHLADSIVGEYHECGGPYDSMPIPDHARLPGIEHFTVETLASRLQRAGFDVTHFRLKDQTGEKDTNIGMFYAHRKPVRRSLFLPKLLNRFRRAN